MTVESEEPTPPPAPPANIPQRLRPCVSDESSWTSLRRILRQADEEQVQECEEKINACLLFSSLFSIMLSVFLVDSLKNLRPNNGALTVELLSQFLAQAQSFLPISQSASATAVPTPYTNFNAQAITTRVNALWTASLVVCLAEASLALVLKQRLCQYVVRTSPSPQADLHSRHTRRSDWGVVEVVTLLPFVSQIPTALFFAGLCLLTLDTSRTVGNTALWITAGWAFMLTVLVYSSLSSHSPYRFPFLESLFGPARSPVNRSLHSAHYLSSIKARGNLEAALKQARTMEDDMDVLVTIYAKHREDHVLNVMWDALRESGATPEDHLRFVWKLVTVVYPSARNTMQHEKCTVVPVAALDLTSLPKSTYATIMDNIADRLFEEMQSQTGINDSKALEWSPWMKHALCLILADSPHPLSSAANLVLTKLMNVDRANAFFDVAISALGFDPSSLEARADGFAYILAKTQRAMQMLKTEDCFKCIGSLVRCCFFTGGVKPPNYNQQFTAAILHHINDIPPAHLYSIGLVLLKRLTDDVYPTMFWFTHLVDGMKALLHIDHALASGPSKDGNLHEELVKVSRYLLCQPKNTAIYMRFATGLEQDKDAEIEATSQLFIEAFVGATSNVRNEILDNLLASVKWQQVTHPPEMDNDWDSFVRLHVMKTYLLILRAVGELKKRKMLPKKESESDSELRRVLAKISTLVSCCLRGTAREQELDKKEDSEVKTDAAPKLSDEDQAGHRGLEKTKDDETVNSEPTPEDKVNPNGKKASDADPVPASEKAAEVTPKQGTKTDATAPAATTSPSPEDIDLAKQCLSLTASLDCVGVTQDTKDEDFAAWAQTFDTASSFFGDDIFEALGEILPEGDSATSARFRRIQLMKKDGSQGSG